MPVHTHVPFTLPLGLMTADGIAHREGVMRRATARDELQPLASAEVRRNEAYLTVLLLARTIVSIGPVTEITPEVIEGMYAADFDHLQRLYERLNTDQDIRGAVVCPDCARQFDVDLGSVQDGPSGK
jgi:hypothetical protein